MQQATGGYVQGRDGTAGHVHGSIGTAAAAGQVQGFSSTADHVHGSHGDRWFYTVTNDVLCSWSIVFKLLDVVGFI